MLTANQIRQTFLDFFKSKGHVIVPSAPMVVKNDPTLMFNNSGMAPFKDIFLGNSPIKYPRVADTQKCLRVSGKHNDLEDVGIDTYHHTMFEMLGNWSFGDYFKEEAIAWAWELLTEVYKIPKDRLYVTVFEGSSDDCLDFDIDAYNYWKKHISEDRILKGSKKDNFWEMGDVGPCGPCTEIHYDGRSNEERAKIPGAQLVNKDHPQVIEIWNNVFMEFNRKADGTLEKLPKKHVDTGMGFERLVRVLQGKQSNYDTDIFTPIINTIEKVSGKKYKPDTTTEEQEKINIAIRVIADHIRAIAFSIADGQLPSNTAAGYVIRRILRRAVRYGYQSLTIREPFMYKLVETLKNSMGEAFPELISQQPLIEKVIKEEEQSFFRTLESGLRRLEAICTEYKQSGKKIIEGTIAFELFDTYGFPFDLTSLIARENNLSIDEKGFLNELAKQKERSRAATLIDTDDWVIIDANDKVEFVGYDTTECETKLLKYRKIKTKGKELYQLIFSPTPFYAESGGQIGDTGVLISSDNEQIEIIDTKKENNLIIHFSAKLPTRLSEKFFAKVEKEKRLDTARNHSATHLLHAALRQVLGTHVEQKGSLVTPDYLRFDFSHFAKVSEEELLKVESLVNQKILENHLGTIALMKLEEAKNLGAMALFGEKYGEVVRVVTFDKNYSIELCGGTHVKATGEIGFFKIISESAVAAGVRRIEALTGRASEKYINEQLKLLHQVKETFKKPKDLLKSVTALIEQNTELQKQINHLISEKIKTIKQSLKSNIKHNNGVNIISEVLSIESADAVKDLAFQLKNEVDNLFLVLGANVNGKPNLTVMISENLVKDKNLHAGNIIKQVSKEINGGGGGQPFYATAGGTKLEGLTTAIQKTLTFIPS
jgi:alanyl-tRNA synthetase